jgi:tripeptide aminopeptidase
MTSSADSRQRPDAGQRPSSTRTVSDREVGLGRDALERFVRYARIDTRSDASSSARPSTPGQRDLGLLLIKELVELGVKDAELTEGGHVLATLPAANCSGTPTVGILAHLDTSPEAAGAGVNPQIWRNYGGSALIMPGHDEPIVTPMQSPLLLERVGHDIVTSDGTTLLGADDKAGIAEIMAAVAYLLRTPDLARPQVRIGFTVDEEIGRGVEHFDVHRFGADFAYTLDGSNVGEVENETFSAVQLTVTFNGVESHPGDGKGRLVNALKLASDFVASLPRETLCPEATGGREGFIHPDAIQGTATAAAVTLLLRDFDSGLLEKQARIVQKLALATVESHSAAQVEIKRRDQYRNMRETLDHYPHVTEAAIEANRRAGLTPRIVSVRGGTDGSLLTAKGLPTPNLFAGGQDLHSTREWISGQDMALAAECLVQLIQVWAERKLA